MNEQAPTITLVMSTAIAFAYWFWIVRAVLHPLSRPRTNTLAGTLLLPKRILSVPHLCVA
jgi:hypothetical protein